MKRVEVIVQISNRPKSGITWAFAKPSTAAQGAKNRKDAKIAACT